MPNAAKPMRLFLSSANWMQRRRDSAYARQDTLGSNLIIYNLGRLAEPTDERECLRFSRIVLFSAARFANEFFLHLYLFMGEH